MRYSFKMSTWLTISLGRGEEHELNAEISYGFNPGSPATPPAYDHGGLPPDPPETEINSVMLSGEEKPGEKKWQWPAPAWMLDLWRSDDELHHMLVEDAGEQMEARDE